MGSRAYIKIASILAVFGRFGAISLTSQQFLSNKIIYKCILKIF